MKGEDTNMRLEIFNFKDERQFDSVAGKMELVFKKDLTFVFKLDKENMKITMEDESKDRLHRRGLWIIHNLDVFHTIVYKVVE